ncbi:hypothetical protein E2562_010818 [Oryza meyeriana var. granulata]|uniref:Uncharacterized protein n=1 Tax=Oryza meyeriana var. granulata TaxID=110450 RepID=A0A6G1BIF4_9ORYZ|nr:hypothetical protein E2562_010818 [Oryza meyeriana var. granulata]
MIMTHGYWSGENGDGEQARLAGSPAADEGDDRRRSDEDDGDSAASTEGGIWQVGRLSTRPTRLGDGNGTPWCGGVDGRPGHWLQGLGRNGAPREEERERGGGFGARRDSARRRQGSGGTTGAAEETEVLTMRGTERNRRLTHVGGVHGGDDVDAEPPAASTEQRHSSGGTDGATAHRRKAALGVAAQARSRRGGG